MDISNTDVTNAVGGLGGSAGIFAVIKSFYSDWINRQEKKEMLKSIEMLGEEIGEHAILDAQTYATRDEMRSLFNHIDRKFTEMQSMIVALIKDGNGHRKSN